MSNLTLYAIEEHLAALVDTADMADPDQQEAIAAEIQQAVATAVEKRDRVAQFLAHCDVQEQFVKAEVKRLQEFGRRIAAARDRVEECVQRAIEVSGQERLEGNLCTFSLRACPPSVEVTDERAVPMEYKIATLTVPAHEMEELLGSVDIDARESFLRSVRKMDASVDKLAVKQAIKVGLEVPGAVLVSDKKSLVRR